MAGDHAQDVNRNSGVGHPRQPGVAKIVAAEVFVAEFGHDRVPVRGVAPHPAHPGRHRRCRGALDGDRGRRHGGRSGRIWQNGSRLLHVGKSIRRAAPSKQPRAEAAQGAVQARSRVVGGANRGRAVGTRHSFIVGWVHTTEVGPGSAVQRSGAQIGASRASDRTGWARCAGWARCTGWARCAGCSRRRSGRRSRDGCRHRYRGRGGRGPAGQPGGPGPGRGGSADPVGGVAGGVGRGHLDAGPAGVDRAAEGDDPGLRVRARVRCGWYGCGGDGLRGQW